MTDTEWLLGLNVSNHDAAAALLHKGELIAFAEEERFTRTKHATAEAPIHAVRFCLDFAGIDLSAVAAVALGGDFDAWALSMDYEIDQRRRPDDAQRLFPASAFGDARVPTLQPINHHRAHAASAFWMSGFEEAAVLVVDNQGEGVSSSLYAGSRKGLQLVASYPVAVSVGQFYESAAEYAGLGGGRTGGQRVDGPPPLFPPPAEVGKLMGLAGYGRPRFPMPLLWTEGGPAYPPFGALRTSTGLGRYRERHAQLDAYFKANCYPFVPASAEGAMAYADFAASAQVALEDVLLGLVARARELTGARRLAFAGGVALNCAANGVIARSGLFDEVFVQPVAHDGGTALGSALELYERRAQKAPPAQRMVHAFWGPAASAQDVRAALDRHGFPMRRYSPDALVEAVAERLARGELVGWFQGRAEVGPRALGARSLLGDPRRRETWVRLNRAKCRESWRPVAPSVAMEDFGMYFNGPHASPFMIVAADVRPEVRSRIPAIVHVDGTARPQVVDRSTHPRYHALLSSFGRRSGVRLLANTSFNRESEPIVGSPDDALQAFATMSEISHLAIGELLVSRP